MTTTIAPLPTAVALVSAMEKINGAQSFKEFAAADAIARELGLKLRRGFYIQRRSIHQERIDLVASARSEAELREILQDINYEEIVL